MRMKFFSPRIVSPLPAMLRRSVLDGIRRECWIGFLRCHTKKAGEKFAGFVCTTRRKFLVRGDR
jgi:hypothetical protein